MAIQSPAANAKSIVLIAHLARKFAHRFEQALAPLGLRQRHLVALSYLRDHGPAPQQALTEALCVDPSNLVALLNELEDGGLALRRRDTSDRRRHIVEIAPAGRQALSEVSRALDAIEDDVLATLNTEERELLHGLLDRALDGRLPACTVEPAA